jgi:hypothetical protein
MDTSDKRKTVKEQIAYCDNLIEEEVDWLKPYKYDYMVDGYEGLYAVKLKGKYGYIDKNGSWLSDL